MASLRQLTKHCNYGDNLNTMLRDRLVCGINATRIQKRLLGSTLTYARALELSLSLEAAERNSTAMQGMKNTRQTEAPPPPPGSSEVYHLKNVAERSKACYRCGARNHTPEASRFKNQECFHCHVRGHISKVCRKKNSRVSSKMRGTGNNRIRTMDAVSGSEADSDDEMSNLYVLKEKRTPPLMSDIRIGGKVVPMEIDAGASLTVMSKKNIR